MTGRVGLFSRIARFAVLGFLPVTVLAQSFIIDDAESYADFNFRKSGNRLSCFYKTWNSDKQSSHYRTISFDANLNVVDTVSYRLNGICSNLGSEENGKYSYHIFYTERGNRPTITFLVTGKSGETLANYEKTAEDLQPFFKKGIKKLSELRFENIKTDGADAGLLLLRPSLYSRSGMLKAQGPWMALNLLEGTLLWQMKTPATFIKSKTMAGKLVTLEKTESGLLFVHYYDLKTGDPLASVPAHLRKGYRTVSVFEVDSAAVILGGGEFEKDNSANKNAHFFLTRFDLLGHMTFDTVDTTARLSGNRLQLLGGVFNPAGDLVLVGESYKIDAAGAVANTAAAVALTVLLGGPVIPSTNVKKIVQAIVTARISASGEVKEFNSFPVDRRTVFSTLIKDEGQIYLLCQSQLWQYDLSDLSSPPRRYKTTAQEQNIITFSGNVIGIRKDEEKREIILENISNR